MRHFVHLKRGPLLCAAVALVACDSSKHAAPKLTGNLAVTLTAGSGTTPAVVVTGPANFNKMLSSTQVLTGLPLGHYSIVADSAMLADSVVGGIVDTGAVTGSPADLVTARDTMRATVAYSTKQRYGAMWIGNASGGALDAIGNVALRASGSPMPVDTLPNAGVSAVALDAAGNLWTISYGQQIREYTVGQRAAIGDTSATVTLIDSTISEPLSMAFDAHGNLWVGDAGRLRAYTPGQLSAGGAATAAVIITSGAMAQTPGIAFDANGNLWVSSYDHSALLKYTAAQLAASGAVDPTDTLASVAGLSGPAGMQFDAHGNLWVANHDASSILMFTPSQLTASGSPTPTVTLTTPSSSSVQMWGMAFDARGSLWVAAPGSDSIIAFTTAQLAATGSPTPAVTLGPAAVGQFAYVSGLVFDSRLPIGANGTGANRIRSRRVTAVRSTVASRGHRLPNTSFFTRH
jgi:streptogramin lyase